ncbi:uncharacterized protein LOC132756457 [Ruditapes philippinarum]|uniref:uncharacterized protein LOC132756457 n=1 Tax=Ruditapes philippinarum TaxID=129788 RepID=UPI00295A6CB8|nr:uncharacterized protein LOC132756457 [Ruditapes philippinarum]
MSEQSDQLSVEVMAIPEGGAQEQMDVSTDDSPGYVSIKTKGPGKPIIIRSDGSEQTLSQFVNSSLSVPTETKDDVYNKYAMDEEDGMVEEAEFYLDKKTGKTIILTKNKQESESNIDDEECEFMQDSELSEKIIVAKTKSLLDDREEIQAKAQTEASFRSQAKVFSIGTNLQDDRPEILNSLSRKKYKLSQKGTKKNVGAKKNSPGKVESSFRLIQRPSPYPNWIMDLPIREALDKAIVDEEGNMLQLQLNLVPMKSGTDFKRVDTLQVQNVQNTGNDIFSEGSIDRPPDEVTCLNFHRNQTGAVSAVALTQPSATTYDNVGNNVGSHQFHDATMGTMSAPNIYGDVIDQPLDLNCRKTVRFINEG